MRTNAAPLWTPARAWRLGMAGLVSAAALWATGTARAADVGVSISVSQPGVYGRVDIGRFPQPAVVMAQPRVVVHAPHPVAVQPVYLWVPPGHRKNWSRHCRAYGACGVPVYFVRDDWYGQHVMADRRGWAPPHQHRDERRDHDRGHGHGHDRGHGHGGKHGGSRD